MYKPSFPKALLLASRPKTWIASLSPVCIGSALAMADLAKKGERIDSLVFALTLLFALFIQIGTNFANDLFDFAKGADTSLRKGPPRATAEGWISPASMQQLTLAAFGIAFFLALPLMLRAGWWSFPTALACILFGLLYTGGPKPLGYLGWGEGLVLAFFGPVAVCGSYFLQTGLCDVSVAIASLAPGCLACSLLIANNLRDEEGDRVAGKKTLVVRFGRRFGSWEYALSVGLAALVPCLLVLFYHKPLLLLGASLVLPLSFGTIKKAFSFQDPLELIAVLEKSALLFLAYTIFFCAGVCP